jgi:acyl-CoA reductase-like NAD-dependent aldehyde dehydrogenase
LNACDAAWKAYSEGFDSNDPWRDVGVERRRSLLNRVADLVLEREEELRAQMEETSCDITWAKANVLVTSKYIREIAACVSSIRGTIPPSDKPGTMAFIYKHPVGPVLVIPP